MCVLVTTADTAVEVESTPVIVSPSVNVTAVLLVPVFRYLTYKVFGAVPSVTSEFTTIACTPEVPPVKTEPSKVDSVDVPENEVSLTAK